MNGPTDQQQYHERQDRGWGKLANPESLTGGDQVTYGGIDNVVDDEPRYDAECEREWAEAVAAVEARLSVAQARAIMAEAEARRLHSRGCNLPVGACLECSPEENVSFGEADVRMAELAAAGRVLAVDQDPFGQAHDAVERACGDGDPASAPTASCRCPR